MVQGRRPPGAASDLPGPRDNRRMAATVQGSKRATTHWYSIEKRSGRGAKERPRASARASGLSFSGPRGPAPAPTDVHLVVQR